MIQATATAPVMAAGIYGFHATLIVSNGVSSLETQSVTLFC